MKTRIRVAMVGVYPYEGNSGPSGGAHQSIYQLVQALDRLNQVELHVVAFANNIKETTVINHGNAITLHFYPAPNPGYDALLLYYGRRVCIRKLLQQIRPDLVHAQEQPADIWAGIASSYPHIATIHGLYGQHYRTIWGTLNRIQRLKWLIPTLVEKYNFHNVQNLIAITDDIALLAQRMSSRVQIFRIDNPIDVAFFGATDQTPKEPVILFAGLLIYRKGVDILLEAIRQLCTIVPNVRVRLVGDLGVDKQYVGFLRKQYSALFGSGQVIFVGLADRLKMLEEYASCSLLCLPSRAESAPVVIAEAMAAGRSVVATRVGGVPEMVQDGVTGRLCDPGNAKQMAECLLELLCNETNRHMMGDRARQVAMKRYHPDIVAEKTLNAYLAVLGNEWVEAKRFYNRYPR